MNDKKKVHSDRDNSIGYIDRYGYIYGEDIKKNVHDEKKTFYTTLQWRNALEALFMQESTVTKLWTRDSKDGQKGEIKWGFETGLKKIDSVAKPAVINMGDKKCICLAGGERCGYGSYPMWENSSENVGVKVFKDNQGFGYLPDFGKTNTVGMNELYSHIQYTMKGLRPFKLIKSDGYGIPARLCYFKS